ncbi:MAG: hypothetical protein IJH86_00140 [Clostridia bacterium]|nr:hypothetical protein [Clostridia bacterium]
MSPAFFDPYNRLPAGVSSYLTPYHTPGFGGCQPVYHKKTPPPTAVRRGDCVGSVRPGVGPGDGLLVVLVHAVGAVGPAAQHVQAELAVVAVVVEGLVAVGFGVEGAGDVLAVHLQYARPGVPGIAQLVQLGGILLGGGLHVRMVVTAHALDADAGAGADVVQRGVFALAEGAVAAVKPLSRRHTGLPGLFLRAAGQHGGLHVPRDPFI